MGRTCRFRSTSGGSFCETTLNTTKSSLRKLSVSDNASPDSNAARRLLEIILQMRDARGRGLLHLVTTDASLLKAAHWLLQRAQQANLLNEFISQMDFESGYSPLSWAILQGSLSVILLLLRFPHERLVQRPMQLLSEQQHDSALDWEGFTPFGLLSELQVKTLAQIRLSLPKPRIVSTATTLNNSRTTRASSFSVDDEQEEAEDNFTVLRQGLSLLTIDDSNNNDDNDLNNGGGCDVMTFGAAHHAALGVSDTTKNSAHQTNRPQRVQEFALGERRDNSAIQVAAAAHHTLILSKKGHVYACGLGKGGRLGTSGREQSTPVPLRVEGSLLKRQVTFVAAAENHSICVTKEGFVFSWGSNRFGQLDASPSTSNIRCLPSRVFELKKPCVAVAAGDRHSVALTRQGEVYTWGDNAAGQLGRNNRKNGIERVAALWSCQRIAIQIAASDQSTLVVIEPSGRGLPVNSVYTWGHGNPVPIKVSFDTGTTSQSGRHKVNPIDIACAKHHNAVVTEDGKVYTFGLHAETLGSKQSSSLVIASPVTGMFPENGGGLAVAVSASDQHTAVVTAQGHLFTWGATSGKDVMGHEGLRWQPSPKRVPGVHRAVGVAVAKEHTVLLLGSSYPDVPPVVADSTLESLAARRVCHHVDMFNVIPIAIMAERSQSRLLQDYCDQFIRDNLDGVLTFGSKSELDVYLNEQLAESRVKQYRDASIHPLAMQVIMADKSKQEWLAGCQEILDNLPVSTLVRYQRLNKRRALSFHEQRQVEEKSQQNLQTGFQGYSERCLMLTSNLNSLKTEEQIKSKYEDLSKEVRGIKKRLIQTTKLLAKDSFSSAEREKLIRRPLLEADLAKLSPALAKVEKLMAERNLELKTNNSVAVTEQEDNKKTCPPKHEQKHDSAEVPSFLCSVCDVTCPDANHLELHKNGRKHRNRMKQAEEEEREQTANVILREKRQQSFLVGKFVGAAPASKQTPASPWSAESVQPRYQLPPPHVPPGPDVVDKTTSNWSATSKTKSLRSILAEEENKKGATHKSQQSSKAPTRSSNSFLSPGPVAPLQNAPWAAAPTVSLSPGPVAPLKNAPRTTAPVVSVLAGNTSRKGLTGSRPSPSLAKKVTASNIKKQSLGDFLNGQKPVKSPTPAAAPWSQSPAPKKIVPAAPSPSPHSKSLLEIQQEEEDFVKRQAKHATKEGKWYLGRADRADSFSAIQETAAQEREWRLLVEEQRQIEEQIARENQQQEEGKNAKKKRTSTRGRNKQQQADGKKNQPHSNQVKSREKAPRKQSQKKSRGGKSNENNAAAKQPVTAAS